AIASTGAARAAYTRRACRCATDRPAKPPGNHVASRAANPAGDAAEEKAEDPVPNPAEDPVEGTVARKDLLPPACAAGTGRGDRVRRCQTCIPPAAPLTPRHAGRAPGRTARSRRGQETIPDSHAQAAISTRFRAPSFAWMLARWVLTVESDTNSSAATSWLV